MVVLAAVVLAREDLDPGAAAQRERSASSRSLLAVAVVVWPSLATGLSPMPESPGMTEQPMSS